MVYGYEIYTYLPVPVPEEHSTQNLIVTVPVDVLTHWPLVIWMKFEISNFQANLIDWWLRYFLQNCPQMNVTGPYGW